MRVLVWGINYAPEVAGIAPCNTALCEYLARQGHEVQMLTSFPYYPAWKKAQTDQGQWYRRERRNGVEVHRCWHYVPASPGGWRRVAHEFSFVFTSTLRAVTLRRPDILVVVSPPLLLGLAAWLTYRAKGTPHIFHVQDLQPDAAVGLGMVKSRTFIDMLRQLEKFSYRVATRVSSISAGMLSLISAKGVPGEKLIYFPNGVTLPGSIPPRGRFREQHSIEKEEFVFLYSGNIGMKQGLEQVVTAASLLGAGVIRLVICGDGAARPHLQQLATNLRVKNVLLLPLQAPEDYAQMMADADVCLISQRAGNGAAFFPSKLLSCLAFGKPIMAVADRESELARIVTKERLGIWVDQSDAGEIARAMRQVAAALDDLLAWARNGLAFVAEFQQEKLLARFERELLHVAGKGPVLPGGLGWKE